MSLIGKDCPTASILLLAFGLLSLCPCCSDNRPGDVPEYHLRFEDSIGVEIGDSNYMFGSIVSICHGADSSILVLDRASACVMQYAANGSFVREIAWRGSGPGELENPFGMAVLGDGRIVIVDTYAGGLLTYSSTGEYLGSAASVTTSPPMELIGVDDSGFVARKTERYISGSRAMFRLIVGRHDLTSDPGVVYFTEEFPLDYDNRAEMMREVLFTVVFTADREGRVFVSPLSSDLIRILGYDSGGREILDINLEMERVEKTDSELDEESEYVEYLTNSLNGDGYLTDYVPDPFRLQVTQLSVDGDGRIWARLGTTLIPTFYVFDECGELLFKASIPEAGEEGRLLHFTIDEIGILAYSDDPGECQKVYMLSLDTEVSFDSRMLLD